MSLTSHTFILLFLPFSLLLYWKVLRSGPARLWALLALSYLFYGLAGWQYVPLLLGLSWLTFLAARKGWFTAGILINLALLASFKFIGFEFTVLKWLGFSGGRALLRLAFPLGLSYYSFKHIGYLLDVKRKRIPATADFLAFTTFSAFFPQISAGPLSSFQDTGRQLRALPERIPAGQIFDAIVYITIGLAKKLLIANVLLETFQSGALSPLNPESGLISAWLTVLSSVMGLYFDFSGYTDIVLGVGLLFGLQLPPNFNNPFLAQNIQEFWNRWHISLSNWFRMYLFFPLTRKLLVRFGQKRKALAQSLANLITMFLVGVWHGITFGNLAWGVLMGLLLNLHTGLKRRNKQIQPQFLATGGFLISIFVSLAIFTSPSYTYAQMLVTKLIGLGGFEGWSHFATLGLERFGAILLLSLLIAFSGYAEADKLLHNRKWWFATAIGLLLWLCLLFMGKPVDFIYVQF